jgi:phage replication-related protein YjqB (UPF0714/DUF867 family)
VNSPSCPHVPAGHHAAVEKPKPDQAALVEKGERCIVDDSTLAAIGVAVGGQLRVRRSPRDLALFTVAAAEPRAGCHGVVRMGPEGLERLGAPGTFPVSLDPHGPHPTIKEMQAPAESEFIERLTDDGAPTFFAALAPHGGIIERYTSEQAEHMLKALPGRCTSWRCKGWNMGGQALKRWHITSTDISDASFPGLASISKRGFKYAVAFHGYSIPRILVGGGAPRALREEVRAAIEKALRGTGFTAALGTEGLQFSGGSPRNVVNRITAGGAGGIQIEQPLDARTRCWREIAEAVAGVFAKKS